MPDGLRPDAGTAPVAPAEPLAAAMTAAEAGLLQAAAAAATTGLEFGCGGSTPLLLEAGLGRLLSVDSDRDWLMRVGADPRCAPALAEGRLGLLHADIGPTGRWGWPLDPARMPQWTGYWRDPWERAGAVDFVLVDGRFRVACALAALPRLGPGARLAVHDFWARPAYQAPILRHFDLVGSAGSLALLAPRRPGDPLSLAIDIAAHALDPR